MKTNFHPVLFFDDSAWASAGTGAITGATTGLAFGPIGAAVGGLIGGGIGYLEGASQKRQANKLLSQNQYKPLGVPNDIYENQQIARNQALQGLPSQQYNQAMQNIQRQQQQAIQQAGDRRAGIGSIGGIQQRSDDAYANLDVQNANARLENRRQLFGINNQVAGYKNLAWQENEQNRQRNYDYGQRLLGAGNANEFGALDSGLAALTGLAGSGLFGKKYHPGGSWGNGSAGNGTGGNPLSIGINNDNYKQPNVQGSGLNPLNLSFT